MTCRETMVIAPDNTCHQKYNHAKGSPGEYRRLVKKEKTTQFSTTTYPDLPNREYKQRILA